jgi:hypothetical protein
MIPVIGLDVGGANTKGAIRANSYATLLLAVAAGTFARGALRVSDLRERSRR